MHVCLKSETNEKLLIHAYHLNKLWIDWEAFYIAVWFYWILSTNIYYVHALLFRLFFGERKYMMKHNITVDAVI